MQLLPRSAAAVALVVLQQQAIAVGAAADAQPVVDLLTRTLGAPAAAQFDVELSPSLCASHAGDMFDCFELSDASASSGKRVRVAGSTLSALTTSVGVYLKRFCNASLTWANTGGLLTGVVAKGSASPTLPPVGRPATGPLRAARSIKYTYYMNVVDYSYRCGGGGGGSWRTHAISCS